MFMENTDAWVQLSAQALTLAGVVFAAVYAKKGFGHSREANQAVNQVGAAGTPRIYDIVLANYALCRELKEWKDGYRGSPWQDAASIEKWLAKNEEQFQALQDHISALEENCPACKLVEEYFRQSSLSPGTGEGATGWSASLSDLIPNEE